MLPGDRLICVLVDNKPFGYEFKGWLLHVTVVPWFRLHSETAAIATGLEDNLRKFKPFTVIMGKEGVRFGHQKGKLATLIQLPSPLVEIEQSVRDYFHDQNAWLVDESTQTKQVFKPHITNQKNGSMHEGDMFTCDKLYIVEQKGGVKEITGEVRLG